MWYWAGTSLHKLIPFSAPLSSSHFHSHSPQGPLFRTQYEANYIRSRRQHGSPNVGKWEEELHYTTQTNTLLPKCDVTNAVDCPPICVLPLLHGNWDKLPKMQTSIFLLGKWFRTSKLHFPASLVVWGGHMLMMMFWLMLCKWKLPLTASLILLMRELRHTCCCASSLPPFCFLEHRCDVCTWRQGHTHMKVTWWAGIRLSPWAVGTPWISAVLSTLHCTPRNFTWKKYSISFKPLVFQDANVVKSNLNKYRWQVKI